MSDTAEVIIVGAGPTGLASAKLLSDLGIRVALIDPFRLASHHPRATHIDDETVRIMQTLGAAHLEPDFFRSSSGGYRLFDPHSQLIWYLPWRPEPTDQGWYGDYQFFQPDFENFLRGRLNAAPNAALWLGWRAQTVTQSATDVTVTMRNDRTGDEKSLTARYLIGCDGARSMVRKLVSPEVEDLHGTHRSLILDIAPLVDSAAVPQHDAFTKAQPPNAITCVPTAHGMYRFEWLLRSSDATEDFEEPSRWYELLKPFYAPGDYRIARADVYRWDSLMPTRWRDNNLFIAGDAAHQMPPFLGQGMCSGLRDAMNLAWKLAACIRDDARESLLDTYQTERAPHVRVFVEGAVAVANGIEAMAESPGELGDPPSVSEVDTTKPPLGRGVHGATAGLVGGLSIQPRLQSGIRLDDAVGYHFAIVGDPTLLASVASATRTAWKALRATVIGELPLTLRSWLNEHRAHALIIRPDRYIFGLAASSAELDRLTARLVGALYDDPVSPGGLHQDSSMPEGVQGTCDS